MNAWRTDNSARGVKSAQLIRRTGIKRLAGLGSLKALERVMGAVNPRADVDSELCRHDGATVA
jgi:hypothetical protein